MNGLTPEQYWYWLVNIESVGQKTIRSLIECFGSPEEIFKVSKKHLEKILRQGALNHLLYSRNTNAIQESYMKMEEKGVYFYSCEHKHYPAHLRKIYDYPYGLYGKGEMPANGQKSVAIVGARDATPYGKEMARFFARELSKNSFQIISGLAKGIDACAHSGALDAGSSTFGVLGCGVDICYPKENFSLYMDILRTGGILSEYPIGTKPRAGHFPMRNRIISGLADAVLLVEAKEKSGSLITADLGLEQGREIYVLPGRATDELSQGCNNLIKIGAKPVTKPEEIMEDYGVKSEKNVNYFKNNDKMLDAKQNLVYSCLSLEPKFIDSIIIETKLSVQEVISILFVLEFNQHIKQVVKNYYIISI